MLTVFRVSTSYTIVIVFSLMLMEPVKAPASWWPCECLKDVAVPGGLEKKLVFLDAYKFFGLVLKNFSNINQ